MGAPRHGVNGLIYVSGTELAGANSWSINIIPDTVETGKFGDGWKGTLKGLKSWSGNITAFDHSDEKIITNAATATTSVALLIYPVRSDLTEYYSGNAVFGMSSNASTTSAVMRDGDFTGDGTLAATGWS